MNVYILHTVIGTVTQHGKTQELAIADFLQNNEDGLTAKEIEQVDYVGVVDGKGNFLTGHNLFNRLVEYMKGDAEYAEWESVGPEVHQLYDFVLSCQGPLSGKELFEKCWSAGFVDHLEWRDKQCRKEYDFLAAQL